MRHKREFIGAYCYFGGGELKLLVDVITRIMGD